MKNGCSENSETQIAERNERAKKLYRYVSDVARRIDEATTACRSVTDLFYTSTEVQRQKLRDNCEKLMFLDPLNYGKKALELLWRKVYYDTVSAAKKLRTADDEYDNHLFTHIMCGIGQLHHLISRMHSDLKLKFKDVDYVPIHKEEGTDEVDNATVDEEIDKWGRSTVHSCLIYLGDLSRYQAEIFHTFDPSIAARYYLQAAHIDLSSGMPYNQLGNLYMDKNHNLDSACYYIHCLSRTLPFEGAMGNLIKLFEKNAQLSETFSTNKTMNLSQVEHIQGATSKFLSLIEIWYLGKEVTDVPQRCNIIAQDIRIALDLEKLPLPDINKNYDEYSQALEEEIINPSYLNESIIHEIVQICIFTVAKISETDEKAAFAAKAFSLAMFSQLLQKLLKQLEKCGLKNPAAKYRRRKIPVPEPEPEPEPVEEPHEEETIEEVPILNGLKEELAENNADVNEDVVEEIVVENGDVKTNSKKIAAKRRRRRRVITSESSEVSDADTESSGVETDESCSEDEEVDTDSSYQTDSKSEASENDCSDEEIDTTKKVLNGNADKNEKVDKVIEEKDETLLKVEHIKVSNDKNMENLSDKAIATSNDAEAVQNVKEIQGFLRGDNILPSMKLLQDWILKEKDLILSCGESGESLFQCVVDLLNILKFYFKPKNKMLQEDCKILSYARSVGKSLELEYRKIPLPEDVNLRGTNICKFDTNAAEWQILNRYKPSCYEENIIRILNFIDFGHQIAKIVPKIRYNRTMQIFYLKKIPTPKLNTKINHKRSREWHNSKKTIGEGEGGLLRSLGRLWLASQVRELERWSRAASPTLLAVDAAALHIHLRRVKQLMRSRTFIILVPTVVLQELDDLKREQSSARDAIRWLESQLQSGSRYVRAQRAGQSRPLPLLKYPRKAPPHVHNYIQILEFCFHFVAEEKPQGGNGDADNTKTAPMLVLLTGQEAGGEEQHKEFSMTGAARAAGVTVHYIVDFYTKWRQTVHKSGKKR